MAAYIDSIDTGALEETPSGYRCEVEAIVTDVGGDIWTRRFNALRTPGLPPPGSQHPAAPGIMLMERRVEPVAGSPSKWRILMTYRAPSGNEPPANAGRFGPTRWSFDATTASERTNVDINGNELRAEYRGRPVQITYSTANGEIGFLGSQIITDTTETIQFAYVGELLEADVERPVEVLKASRWERDDPEPVAATVFGTVNRSRYRGKAPRTLLCRAVRGQPAANGAGFDTEYEFAWLPGGYQVRGTVTVNGKIPADATVGNGIEFFDVYPEFEFAQLSL